MEVSCDTKERSTCVISDGTDASDGYDAEVYTWEKASVDDDAGWIVDDQS